RLTRRDDRLCYLRCRLDIPFPILEVASEPAAGHAVTIGPLRGRRLAQELVEQLDSLFGLRHCGRRLQRRQHPSANGQRGRGLSPCLGDLDPNLYRRRLDDALGLFLTETDGRERLLAHVQRQMREASAKQHYERAAWLRRRLRRLTLILERLSGTLEATHVRAKLILAAHPVDSSRQDAFWLAGGRLVDWGPAPEDTGAVEERSRAALRRGSRVGELGAHVPPDEIDELRIIATYLASHPETTELMLDRPRVSETAAL
ncbi:MAG: UvrB/UvrC motif-containing protein, partial [Solirubrobacterales bacterium]|nr:UvrB/UvrC motif-containing protein [Solirubrobacterales bacterium]